MKKVLYYIALFFYRIYEVVIGIPVLILATIITCIVTAFGCMWGDIMWWSYYPASLWGKLMCRLFWVRIKLTGSENASDIKSCVYVANHQSAFDIFLSYAYLRHNFLWMMKKSLKKIPFLGWACGKMGQVFVDNSSPAAVKATMEKAEMRLKEGRSMVIFPEGTRTATGKMARFKRGAYVLAKEFNLPVVPLTIDGAFDVWPKTAWLPTFGTIRLTIHPAIFPGEEGHDINALVAASQEAVGSALPERLRFVKPLPKKTVEACDDGIIR